MKRAFLAALLLFLSASPLQASDGPAWSWADLATLERWVEMAPQDALPSPSTQALDAARTAGASQQVDEEAARLALQLARMHLLGRAKASERTGWHIADSDRELELDGLLEDALASHSLNTFFAMMRPTHAEYAALRSAYHQADDPQHQIAIARNMERWRWLPRELGKNYVLVNAPLFEAGLWRDGQKAGTWRVIVGKQSTPTPVFSAEIEGVILNPWWNIPASIVRESVGALVRRNPAAARARGYVWEGGRYRQRPGPNNALGQMKLVMPNRFTVYMHDTPNKALFEQEVRAFSHGCVRTGDALGYAETLLEGIRSRDEIDAIVESRQRTQIDLAAHIPIYLTYFTAVSDGEGGVAILTDIYGRDRRIEAPAYPEELVIGGSRPAGGSQLLSASYMPSSTSDTASDAEFGPEC